MTYVLSRPAPAFSPSDGLAQAEHFQMAYATNDLDRAGALLRDRLGIKEFRRIGGTNASGCEIWADLAWVGTLMYELITASGPGADLYMGRLPQDAGFAMKHHHLGYLIADQAQWDGVLAGAERNGWAVPYCNANPMMQTCIVDATELGHYLEYLFPVQAGIDFFNGVPRN